MSRKLMGALVNLAMILFSMALSRCCMAQLVPYDNFNSRSINPAKWSGGQNYDPDLREAFRLIAGDKNHGRLRLMQTAYSSMADDIGGSGGVFGLQFLNPEAITEVSFLVAVDRAEAVGCPSNDSLIVTGAEFRGTFFNTEKAPTSQIGNVTAVIDVERNPASPGKSLMVAGFFNAVRRSGLRQPINVELQGAGLSSVRPGGQAAPSMGSAQSSVCLPNE